MFPQCQTHGERCSDVKTQIHAVADPWASVGLLDVSTTKKQPKLGPEIPAGQQTGLTEGLILHYRSLIQNSEPEFLHLYIAVTCWDPVSRYNQAADVSRVQVLLNL